ncbi:CD74 molecule, major histocompatibility complex, class II invariant chain b isoform X2 [Hypomesus transpacificus]|uniref:CD74 molecule, major histocompatibility complex, class II invariant chain b isoform X2 n=1 Tax=Hypomesus transpacificus TaxID=137520 RepID=UPI001F07B9B5|nr:CD74 molecule, major histocompatibility complex, class II invariant chain b isoform X2 [Hypomesus transpacificus]XP_046899063.1 CD74 molecule, major histocompatibility complex, class II invariant chain b isoform X2 [Hypomesus transpacificus]XP_046899064.1 CD74 molecule, major histocompatibility complex, class II invariant chain b isoform X2 [Hypomesus transpacificus]XP_046899065.1 CD74 molecule, major histocompatibility complex, class II invariant chain b isoform X2 [Hypomesus transpacificus]
MTESEPTRPLIGASSQQTMVDVGTPTVVGPSPSSTRAYKVVGFTLLACLLIAGQAVTAYFLLRQGNDISGLEKQTDSLKGQMTNSRSASVPMKMHVPMNPMPKLVDLEDEDSSTELPGPSPVDGTQCQLEALGLVPVMPASFRPACDEEGNYVPQQCWKDMCWCVDASGKQVEGSIKHGKAFCAVSSGMSHGLVFSDE